VSTYTIGEIADRSGFTASALRYYEGIGLVAPTSRTDAGYRVYDDDTLARLAFIDRAKQLGCSLEEITVLVGIWDGERCGPVQRRFHELVTTKLAEARSQIGELTAFTAQLHAAAAQLSREPVDGPCSDDCACLSDAPAAAEPLALSSKPVSEPIACTLDARSMPARLAEWKGLLAHATSRSTAPGAALRIEFDRTVAVDELARLVAAEQQCCTFFSFAITVDTRGVALELDGPADATELVTALFGAPA
jgi:DNA-binding transcriptional MerR regulator